MNNNRILRSWREQKVMLKWRFSILSDEDFEFAEGEKEEMFARLRAKLGKSKDELDKILAELQLC